MRRLVGFLVVLALLWTGLWFALSWGIRTGVTAWAEGMVRNGAQVQTGGMSTSGFPFRHRTLVTTPVIAGPQGGWASDWVELDSPAWWPGDQTLRFAPEQAILSNGQRIHLAADAPEAALRLSPSPSLALDRLGVTTGPWSIGPLEEEDPALSGVAIALSVAATGADGTYDVSLDLPRLAPGPRIRAMVQADDSLPDTLSAADAEGTLHFDRPFDRHALGANRPQPTRIEIRSAKLAWGDLSLGASGTLDIDDAGIPEGVLEIEVTNWRRLLAMAQVGQALPPQLVTAIERAIGVLAMLGGNTGTLTLQLNFRSGIVALGPLPLGPAPVIRL
ncbi:DUF2125 domain-containing protein [Chachezhania sediminis]|uniref:DUF2125 domain-containing protein n=1 Tax=Chachezhania sediminis TaxID=2599291 RepID=UPI00131C84CE|nr:DUF2125 domain-containing protein [Chachezhania sediminis]